MALGIANFDSVAPGDIEKLQSAGIVTTDDLVRQAAKREGRRELAGRSKVDETALIHLVRMGDLMRIVGINEAHTQLLIALNAGCVAELRTQDSVLLVKAMRRKNVELTLVRAVPPESTVARWVADAKALPDILEV